jgi:hypothetical protein
VAFFVDGKEEFLPQFARVFFVLLFEHIHLRFFQQSAHTHIFDQMHQLLVFRHALKNLIQFERGIVFLAFLKQLLCFLQQASAEVALAAY